MELLLREVGILERHRSPLERVAPANQDAARCRAKLLSVTSRLLPARHRRLYTRAADSAAASRGPGHHQCADRRRRYHWLPRRASPLLLFSASHCYLSLGFKMGLEVVAMKEWVSFLRRSFIARTEYHRRSSFYIGAARPGCFPQLPLVLITSLQLPTLLIPLSSCCSPLF
ncbi:hypothetical protein VIGAN_10150000 [Vigna angularis var. angularis]|uniref:Uncharacterized protein n=1 Tax=Vigna angularis var. angularis TaxID=157739 RepID=A0A0S3T504_PHAAN|nr:hypothetical protein VIGAN_10150000 [Vigna angularis var. angularis]